MVFKLDGASYSGRIAEMGTVERQTVEIFGREEKVGDWIVVDREHARRLARGRTDQPGELGEVVRRVELVARLAPLAAVHEIVPVRNNIAERAALVTERNAAIHAARRLRLQLLLRKIFVDFFPVVDTLLHGPPLKIDSADL